MTADRRSFLAACGVAAGTLAAGCAGRLGRRSPCQVVAGVEWKTLRGIRDGVNRKVAQNVPRNGPVVHDAPVALDLVTQMYDDAVVEFDREGPLRLDERTRGRVESGYENPYRVIVCTLYERDRVNDVPYGNAGGYRVGWEAFDRVDPGDRVSFTVDDDADVPRVRDLLTVERADEG